VQRKFYPCLSVDISEARPTVSQQILGLLNTMGYNTQPLNGDEYEEVDCEDGLEEEEVDPDFSPSRAGPSAAPNKRQASAKNTPQQGEKKKVQRRVQLPGPAPELAVNQLAEDAGDNVSIFARPFAKAGVLFQEKS
jgi:hypothetical protein